MGVAVILILLHHIDIHWQNANAITHLFCRGYIGVDFFLFLSVFGCCHSYEKHSIGSFYYRRFARIYPCYLPFLIAATFVYSMTDKLSVVLVNISGLSIIGAFDNIVAWYVPASIALYLLFPILYRLIRWISCKCVSFHVICLSFILIFSIYADKYLVLAVAYRIPLVYISFIYFFLSKDKERSRYIIPLLCFSALLCLMVDTDRFFLSMLAPLLLTITVDCVNCVNGKVFSFFSFLGRFSLEIYLAQYLSLTFFLENNPLAIASENLKLAISLLMVVVYSVIIYFVGLCINKMINLGLNARLSK